MSDQTPPERKASDVLLAIEQKVDCLIKYFQTVDFNLKILINRVNELESKIESSNKEIQLPEKLEFPKAKLPSKDPVVNIEAPISSTISVDAELPVCQKLIYHTGAPIRLCNVEIFNSKGSRLKKIRTNSSGKWNSNLFPGAYKIRIYKSAVDKYAQIDDTYDIMIPSDKSGFFELSEHKSL